MRFLPVDIYVRSELKACGFKRCVEKQSHYHNVIKRDYGEKIWRGIAVTTISDFSHGNRISADGKSRGDPISVYFTPKNRGSRRAARTFSARQPISHTIYGRTASTRTRAAAERPRAAKTGRAALSLARSVVLVQCISCDNILL